MTTTAPGTPVSTPQATPKKKLRRVRKLRDKDDASAKPVPNLGAPVWKTLTSSRVYALLLLIRFALVFVTPATLEGTEFDDGVDSLAVALLPGINAGGTDPAIFDVPSGMAQNRTRSIVGAFVTSGIPYMGANVVCTKLLGGCPAPSIGLIAMYAPRVWMFFLSLLGDLLLVRCFAVYEGENAIWALLTYASTWTTLLAMSRNINFALEALCVIGLIAACFGWAPNTARPVFWLSAMSLSLGVFLRPPFAFFICTPLIYLSSLWGKAGIDPIRYVRASLEGIAIFAFWSTIWVTVDSIYFGTFKIRFGEKTMESFSMFLDFAFSGMPFSYKGALVYTPLNAMKEVANRQYLSIAASNTSPGQMFLSLPAILGPLFIVLLRESYEGMKVAMKELMSDLKQAANSKKPKRRKPKKAGMTKELEDELYVYFDTIQTTFLLGLLIEVIQNNGRLGVLSLIPLMPICVICIAGTVFGPESSKNFRMLHIVFTVAMVAFYGFLNQSGIPRVLLQTGAGGLDVVPANSELVVFKGIIGHRSMAGANLKNITLYDGGDSRLNLMTTLRDLKGRDGYREDRLFVVAPATVDMKEGEFALVDTLAYGHMAVHELPNNIDDAFKKSQLVMYKFVGDEDEAIMRDEEEAAEQEEQDQEEKEREKTERQRKKKGGGAKEDL